eukprot:354288-Chlamydomonas_euryale.AAC.2
MHVCHMGALQTVHVAFGCSPTRAVPNESGMCSDRGRHASDRGVMQACGSFGVWTARDEKDLGSLSGGPRCVGGTGAEGAATLPLGSAHAHVLPYSTRCSRHSLRGHHGLLGAHRVAQ